MPQWTCPRAPSIEPALRKSITFDNDTAFAQHALLRTMRAMTTWFCDADFVNDIVAAHADTAIHIILDNLEELRFTHVRMPSCSSAKNSGSIASEA